MARKENGNAVLTARDGSKVVALDILAKLSGVGANRVARILAALEALAQFSGLTLAELANLEHAPLAAPDEERGHATEGYYLDMQDAGVDLEKIKHL